VSVKSTVGVKYSLI